MAKLIFKGVVKENLDPKGLGRVRIEPEDWIVADEKYINEYLGKFKEEKDKWSQPADPFLFRPLLPNHINMVPQVGESVNILYTDVDRPFVDGFYIPSSVVDRGYSDSSSAEHTLAESRQGLNYKKAKDLIKDTGEYVKKRYDGSYAKNEDFAINGRGNSDAIWTPKSVIFRAGKLDEKVSLKQREPIRDFNPAIIQVSKYDNTLTKVPGEDKVFTESRIAHVEILVEYFIEDLNPSTRNYQGALYIYKLAKNEGKTETIYFNNLTNIDEDGKELLFTKELTSPTLDDLSFSIRHSIKQIISVGTGGIAGLDFFIKHPSNVNPSKNTSMYPFYFRPVVSMYEQYKTNSDFITLTNNIHIKTRKGHGLLFDEKFDDTPTKTTTESTFEIQKEEKSSKNVIVLSDTNYFLAYNNNVPTTEKGIDFSKVSNYEISQDEIINNILPETYALVRGEKLQELLDVIYLFLVSHVHNPAEPAIVQPSVKQELEQKFQDFKQNILSQKLRIN